MLFVIPGFPLITGGIDLSKLDLRSGLERVTYALLIIAMATLTGWITATLFSFSPSDFEALDISPVLMLVFRLVTSFCGVYGFSLMFNSPRKIAFIAGIMGMIANTLRLELIDFTNIPVSVCAFIGALFCLFRLKIKNCSLLSLIIAHGIYDALIVVWTFVFGK
jgi:uncharacterized membrane protein YjjP (DUF1212 family)